MRESDWRTPTLKAPIVGANVVWINGRRRERPFQIAQQWQTATGGQ